MKKATRKRSPFKIPDQSDLADFDQLYVED